MFKMPATLKYALQDNIHTGFGYSPLLTSNIEIIG